MYGDAPGSFYDSLVRSAEKYPDRICITDNAGTSYTYSRLLEMTDDFSRVLFHRYGVRPGMRIGLLLYNCIGFLRVILRDQQTERRIRAPLDQVPESRSPFPDREGVSERTDTG